VEVKLKTHNSRYIAFQLLKDDRNFLPARLSDKLRYTSLTSRDKALVTQLVHGINREQLFLDWAISLFSSRPIDEIDKDVKILLRLGVYQLLCLDKIPPYAAISETVELGKTFLPSRVVKYINGVLRTVDRQKAIVKEGPSKEDNLKFLSIYYSHPEWLITRWCRQWGEDFTRKLCEFNNSPPPLTVRVNTLKILPEELLCRFKEDGISSCSLKIVPEGLKILSYLRAEELSSYDEGLFTIQGESSMIAGKVLNPQEGDKVMDLCAAPGNKTTHIAELMNNKGHISAVDISKRRLSLINSNCLRLGINIITPVACDVMELGSDYEEKFDRVLLDAPCSGTGVLGRRSDLRWNKEFNDIKRLSLLQRKLLIKASSFVRPGGSMVYSVCSIEPEEGEEVVKSFIKDREDFFLEELMLPTIINNTHTKGLLILPSLHGIEGFFIARFRKK